MLLRTFTLILSLLFAGCTSSPMVVASNQRIAEPPSGKSQIIFLRSSPVGSTINGSLFDVTGGETRFIGIVSNGTKVRYVSDPGRKTFMVLSETADFMKAELEAGRTYYSIVIPRRGVRAARFSLWPVKRDASASYHLKMPAFAHWLDAAKLVENSQASLNWAEESEAMVEAKKAEYWANWQQKSPEELARRSLSPEDGI